MATRTVTLAQAIDAMRPYAESSAQLKRYAEELVAYHRIVSAGGKVTAWRIGEDECFLVCEVIMIREFSSHPAALRGQDTDRAAGWIVGDWFAYRGTTSYTVRLPDDRYFLLDGQIS